MTHCSCPKRCPDRETMRREHGTPSDYIAALERAVDGLMITPAEATVAAVMYANEYQAMPECSP